MVMDFNHIEKGNKDMAKKNYKRTFSINVWEDAAKYGKEAFSGIKSFENAYKRTFALINSGLYESVMLRCDVEYTDCFCETSSPLIGWHFEKGFHLVKQLND